MSTLFRDQIPDVVAEETSAQRLIVDDWHTHLLGPQAGPQLCLYGIDQQLAYHYVRRKLFAAGHIDPATFYSYSLEQQGDFTWQKLFASAASDPFDEGCRGVVVALEALGLDPNAATLNQARQFYADTDPSRTTAPLHGAGRRAPHRRHPRRVQQPRAHLLRKRRVGRVLFVRLPPRRTRLALPACGRAAQRLWLRRWQRPQPARHSPCDPPLPRRLVRQAAQRRVRRVLVSRPTAKSTTSAPPKAQSSTTRYCRPCASLSCPFL